MDKLVNPKKGLRCVFAALACLSVVPIAAEAAPKKTKVVRTPAVFDIQTRKRTRMDWGRYVSGTAYVSAKANQQTNRKRDDGVRDRTDRAQLTLGVAARAQISDKITGFGHAELIRKNTETTAKSYGGENDLRIKELLLSARLASDVQITAGRMRFRDADSWVADSAVDGLHLGWRWTSDAALNGAELAVLRGTYKTPADYALGHIWQMKPGRVQGLFAVAEDGDEGTFFHLSGYHKRAVTTRFSYSVSAAARTGRAEGHAQSGLGFDVRATHKLTGTLNPQITFGVAAGNEGFAQTSLHSNKTYDGGQRQMHRYGDIYRPELTNLAVATVALGIRPSRKFSATLTAHAYRRVSANGPEPVARLHGDLSGDELFLGHEVTLAGAWRPSKKSKVEAGIGRFSPGPAYADRSSSTRLFARVTLLF